MEKKTYRDFVRDRASANEVSNMVKVNPYMSSRIHSEAAELYAQEVAKECCQRTFNKILDEITPFLKSLDGEQYHAVVNAFLHTDPILP